MRMEILGFKAYSCVFREKVFYKIKSGRGISNGIIIFKNIHLFNILILCSIGDFSGNVESAGV